MYLAFRKRKQAAGNECISKSTPRRPWYIGVISTIPVTAGLQGDHLTVGWMKIAFSVAQIKYYAHFYTKFIILQ